MLATLFRVLGAVALFTFPLSILATRLEIIHFRTAFDLIGYSAMLAVAVFLVGTIVGFVWRKSAPELARAGRFASMLCILPILILGNQMLQIRSLPPIHNISTDVQNPPSFAAIAELRGADANPLAYSAENIEPQQLAYPNVKTLGLEVSALEAFERSLQLAQERGWEVVAQDSEQGIIEATATTLLWGFKDDVVVRVTADGERSLVDMRSVSRVGAGDIGANAKRIEKFLADLAD